LARGDPLFAEALKAADLLVPDGLGVVIASRMLGGLIAERVTGTDIFLGLSQVLNERGGYSYFFLGSTKLTLARIKSRLERDFPNIAAAGTYSPPFREEFSAEENQAMIEAINCAGPDVLWVGMTAPKQEKWIYRNRERLDVKFIGAIGAAFDYYAGTIRRPHPVFLRLGLEWLVRFLGEPRRLWRRNLVSTPAFFWQVIQCKLLKKRESVRGERPGGEKGREG
jgi:N-acetylglucosaminyldiphosphoundecaprenol N-acetyl-beta-D-mannosaminyltransferase